MPSVDLICLISLICLSSPSGFGLAARILTGTFAGHTITRVPLVVAHDGLCGVNGGTNSPSVTLGVDIVTH
ncbi:MAG TPA: hypothetical protein VGO80_13495 [Solirubrobacteraceae bacterium]|nr:hypothetical protein [Solirubrobacteraceae bacterium]